jgi:hypothetical protein
MSYVEYVERARTACGLHHTFLHIIVASQRSEEAEQRIVGLEPFHRLSRRHDLFQDVLFGGKVGFEIPVRRLHTLMAKPQSNDREIYSGLEEMHGNGVPNYMW